MTEHNVVDQHADYRLCHFGGAAYLLVEGLLWGIAAAFGAAGAIQTATILLLFGGVFIHPIAMGISRIGRFPSIRKDNRLPILNTWLALMIPLGLPLIFMVTFRGNLNLLFPAFSILVGVHWLPFTYIYAMKSFVPLSCLLVASGIVFGFFRSTSFSTCGFIGSGLLLLFAVLHYALIRREKRNTAND